MLRIALVLFLSIFLSTVAHAQSISVIDRIIRGTPVSEKSVPVVKLLGTDNEGQFLCSGSLIAPDVVLTASHCIPNRPSQLSAYIRGNYRAVSKLKIHPGRSEDPNTGQITNDVALVFLKRAAPGSSYSILSSHIVAAGDDIHIYGFGLDENQNLGVLREGHMTVDSYSNLFINARYDGSTTSNTCNGDSGGPALTTSINAVGHTVTGIVGVVSGGQNADCGPGDLSYFSTVQDSRTLKFLKSNVKKLVVR